MIATRPRFGPRTNAGTGGSGRAVATVCLLLACLASIPVDGHAQPGRTDSLRRIQSVEPGFGPVGTEVVVYTEDLPYQARVHVGLGATHSGWEALAEATQGSLGEVSAQVRVPDFATWDRALLFIVFDASFSPIAISDPFHVTDDEGRIHRQGRVTDEGLGCVGMRDSDDYFYTLQGDVEGLSPGDEIVVEGVFEGSGAGCTQGSTIRVARVERGG